MFKFGKKKNQGVEEKQTKRQSKAQARKRARDEASSEETKTPVSKSRRPVSKKKSMVHRMKDTAWDMIYEDLTLDDYHFSSDKGFYGLMLTDEILMSVPPKDEALGSLLSLINKGVIKTMVTQEAKSKGYAVLLLDAESIEMLEEYEFVWGSPMEAVLIESDGEMIPTGFSYLLSDMQVFATAETGMTLEIGDDVLGGTLQEEQETNTEVYSEQDYGADDAISYESFYADSNDEEDPVSEADEDEIKDQDFMDDFPDDLELDSSASIEDNDRFGADSIDTFGDFEGENEEDEAENGFTLHDEDEPMESDAQTNAPYPSREAVELAVKRVFSEGDLNLEVNPDLFDAQFPASELVLFDEHRRPLGDGDGHLEEYLNQLSSQANAALKYFHESNREYLREQYVSLISMVCSHIAGTTALDDPKTVAGKQHFALKQAQSEQIGAISGKVRERTEEMNREWQRRIEDAGNAAKEAAMQQYKQRYQRSHEDALGSIGKHLRRDIDVAFHKALDDLNENRKGYARRMYDVGCNHTLSKISDMYRQKLEEEADIRGEFDKNITSFIRNNYKNETERVQILRESLQQKLEADRVREEYESKLNTKSEELVRSANEHDIAIQEFKTKLDELAREKDEYHAEKMKRAEDRYQSYESDIAAYRKDIISVQDRTAEEYKSQIRILQNVIEANRLQLTEQDAAIKRKSGGSLLAVAVVAVVMLSVGALTGFYLKLNAMPSFISSYERTINTEASKDNDYNAYTEQYTDENESDSFDYRQPEDEVVTEPENK